jgi:hypothetical protein
MKTDSFVSLVYESPDLETLIAESSFFYQSLAKRRSVRHFSNQTEPKEVIAQIILAAGTAPSGARKKP